MPETSSTVDNIINHRNRDCLGCRIVSGCGLIGSGLYVSHHSKKFQKNIGKSIMYTIGSGNSFSFHLFYFKMFCINQAFTCLINDNLRLILNSSCNKFLLNLMYVFQH